MSQQKEQSSTGKIKWEKIKINEAGQKKVQDILGLDPLLTKILVASDIHKFKKQEIKQFVSPAKSLLAETNRLTAPEQLKAALDRLERALQKKEKIIIHGDSDADGISGTTILVVALRQLGLTVIHDFPIRPKEGHGVQIRIIEEALKNKCSLMLTTDCGTKDVSAIAYAQEKGLDVIVTDHHKIGLELPKACAIINPLLFEKETPDCFLCGAGVAFKLMIALAKRVNKTYPKKVYQFMLVMAALGTISDRMTFKVAQNRCIVYFGIREFNQTTLPGLQALLNLGKQDKGRVYARDVGRTISPRLNAPGRIGDPEKGIPDSNLVVELLVFGVIETGVSQAKKDKKLKQYMKAFLQVIELNREQKESSSLGVNKQAEMVDEVNEERKKITEKIASEIDDILEKNDGFLNEKVIVVKGKNWNSGVIGIDADRLRERLKKPVVIMTEYSDSSYLKASVRSLPSINMYELLETIQINFIKEFGRDPFVIEVNSKEGDKLVNSFGGHSQACGFSMHLKDYNQIVRMIKDLASELDETSFTYQLPILDTLQPNQINMEFFKLLQKLNPYGEQFDFPIFLIKKVQVGQKTRPFGNKYHQSRLRHVEFNIINPENKNHHLKCVGFNLWEKYQELVKAHQNFDFLVRLEYKRIKSKKPRSIIQLNVLDMQPSPS